MVKSDLSSRLKMRKFFKKLSVKKFNNIKKTESPKMTFLYFSKRMNSSAREAFFSRWGPVITLFRLIEWFLTAWTFFLLVTLRFKVRCWVCKIIGGSQPKASFPFRLRLFIRFFLLNTFFFDCFFSDFINLSSWIKVTALFILLQPCTYGSEKLVKLRANFLGQIFILFCFSIFFCNFLACRLFTSCSPKISCNWV